MSPLTLDQMFLCGAAVVAVIGSVFDVRERRLPNWLTYCSMGTGLLLHMIIFGLVGFATAFAAMLIGGVAFLLFLLAGGVAAGDMKMMMAVGSLSGLHYVPQELLLTAVAGGIGGVIFALVKGRIRAVISNCFVLLSHHKSNGLQSHAVLNVENAEMLRMPYGVFIAMGAVGVLLMAR